MIAGYPNSLADKFDLLAVAADTDILDDDIVIPAPRAEAAPAIRITVCASIAAKFRIVIERNGVRHTGMLWQGVDLTANASYTFTHGVRKGDLVNFQISAGPATVKWLLVEEVMAEEL